MPRRMPRLLIACDLRRPATEYEALLDYLRQIEARQVLSTVWIVVSQFSPGQIYSALKGLLASEHDRLLVCRFDVYGALLKPEDGQWLKENLPQ